MGQVGGDRRCNGSRSVEPTDRVQRIERGLGIESPCTSDWESSDWGYIYPHRRETHRRHWRET